MTDIKEEKQFICDLRESHEPLQTVAAGRFEDKQYPLDYAYGLMLGAGLTRCECGVWGDVEDLLIDRVPIPCPHRKILLNYTCSCDSPYPVCMVHGCVG